MKVFISHTSDDHEFVLALAEKLKNDGMDVWIDDWELNVGDSIVKRISEGLQKSSFLIVVFSKYSIKSEWVLRELIKKDIDNLRADELVIVAEQIKNIKKVSKVRADVLPIEEIRKLTSTSKSNWAEDIIRERQERG